MWTGLVTRWWLQLAGRCEKAPDGDLSGAYGDLEALRTLRAQLEPLLADEAALIVALQGVPLDQLDS